MYNEVNKEVWETGKALIQNGEISRLVTLIENELNWLTNKDDIVRKLKDLDNWNQPMNPDLQRIAITAWERAKGSKRRNDNFIKWADRFLIVFIGAGSLSGVISLIWLITK